jgi:hypothetical protein
MARGEKLSTAKLKISNSFAPLKPMKASCVESGSRLATTAASPKAQRSTTGFSGAMNGDNPELLRRCYMQLVFVEEAFRTLKGDLGLRPICHQLEHRIEAHIFISFLAYCLQVTSRRRRRDLVPGLTPRSVLEKFGTLQMPDVHLPTIDERTVY